MNIAYLHDKYSEGETVFASVNFFVDRGLTPERATFPFA